MQANITRMYTHTHMSDHWNMPYISEVIPWM